MEMKPVPMPREPGLPEEPPAEICSEDLMAGRSRLRIRHEGQVYLLRVTRQGKLLLTK